MTTASSNSSVNDSGFINDYAFVCFVKAIFPSFTANENLLTSLRDLAQPSTSQSQLYVIL